MRGMLRNKIGLAGELRVMSELLLRGHNPAKSYLEEGADIILESGLRIEVKSAHRCHHRRRGKEVAHYLFTLRGGARKQPQSLIGCDFIITWCIDDSCFFIIPKREITGTCIAICRTSEDSRGRYSQYKNKWDLLEAKDVRLET